MTADGYAVDENGAWIVDKIVQQTQVNSGNRDVRLFDVMVGDDFVTVKVKLNSCHYILHTDIGNYGNGSYDFWCGDAALFQATFVDNVLMSYHYEVRYTG